MQTLVQSINDNQQQFKRLQDQFHSESEARELTNISPSQNIIEDFLRSLSTFNLEKLSTFGRGGYGSKQAFFSDNGNTFSLTITFTQDGSRIEVIRWTFINSNKQTISIEIFNQPEPSEKMRVVLSRGLYNSIGLDIPKIPVDFMPDLKPQDTGAPATPSGASANSAPATPSGGTPAKPPPATPRETVKTPEEKLRMLQEIVQQFITELKGSLDKFTKEVERQNN